MIGISALRYEWDRLATARDLRRFNLRGHRSDRRELFVREGGHVTVSSPFVRRLNNSGAVLGGNGRYTSAAWRAATIGGFTTTARTRRQISPAARNEFTPGGTGIVQRQSTGTALNDAGDAMGFSRRFTSTGTQIGQDAWVVHNGATHLAGLTDPEYSFTQTGGVYRNGSPKLLNATGQVAGTSERAARPDRVARQRHVAIFRWHDHADLAGRCGLQHLGQLDR